MSDSDGSIVFLCGAGLSVDAGLPSSTELVNRLYHYLEVQARDGQDGAAPFLAALNFVVGGIRFQQGVLCQDPRQPINIEQVANAALRLAQRHRNPLAPYASGWHRRIDELESARPGILDHFVEVTYSRLAIELTPKPDADLSYLYRFNDFIELSPQLDIFTLNYDLCVETIFTKQDRQLVNGFTDSGWDPSHLKVGSGIRLIKLHGSLDWLDHEEHGICAVDFPGHQTLTRADMPPRPLLIFGTDQKTTGLDPFLTLLYHFSEALDRARVLVVIGYSFADEYINEMLRQRMATNPRLRLVVVEPDAAGRVDQVEWLRRRPLIVSHLNLRAREALQQMSLRDHVAKMLDDGADEPPF